MKNNRLAIVLLLMTHSVVGQHEDDSTVSIMNEIERIGKSHVDSYQEIDVPGKTPVKYKHFRRFADHWTPRLEGNTSIESYFRKEKDFYDQLGIIPTSGGTWRELGPIGKPLYGEDIYTGGNGWMERGVGPVDFITFYRFNTAYKLCGSLNGGLFYRSPSNPDTWKAATLNGWNTVNGCIWADYDHSDPKRVFAASSRGNNMVNSLSGSFAQASAIGLTGGVFRNNNLPGGQYWVQIADHSKIGGAWSNIFKLVVDPYDANVIYVATSKGLFKTQNATLSNGANVQWSKIMDGYVYDLEMSYLTNATLYATVRTNGVWRLKTSGDYGQNWTDAPNHPSFPTSTENVTIERTEADYSRIYLVHQGGSMAFYKINTNTGTWQYMGIAPTITFGHGHGFGVSNNNADMIFISRNDRYARSSDGGVSWTIYDKYSTNKQQYHVDVEDFACKPGSSEIWMANHGGLHRSTNNGQTWINESSGLGIAEVKGMALAPNHPDRLMAGLYHDASVHSIGAFNNQNWQPEWATLYTGDGMQPLIDYLQPNYVYASCQRGNVSGFYKSANIFTQTGNETNLFVPWVTSLAMNSEDPTIIYQNILANSTCEQVTRMFNRLDVSTKEQISSFTNSGGNILFMKTAPSDADYLYVYIVNGIEGKKLYRSHNITTYHPYHVYWEEIPLPDNSRWVGDIEVDYNDPEKIWLTYSSPFQYGDARLVYYFNGQSWTDKTNNLSNYVNAVVGIGQERSASGGIYVSTDYGVFYADDSSLPFYNAWSIYGTGLPNLPGQMELNYSDDKVRVGTEGRGFWENDFIQPSVGFKADLRINVRDNRLSVQYGFNEIYAVWPEAYTTGVLRINDVFGREIVTRNVSGTKYCVSDLINIPGIYTIQFVAPDHKIFSEKLILKK